MYEQIVHANRIAIFGTWCSGKSTFGEILREILDIEVLHLESIITNQDGSIVLDKIFLDRYNAFLNTHSRWIIEGNHAEFRDLMADRIKNADIIFVFDTNRALVFLRNLKRFFKVKVIKSENRIGAPNCARSDFLKSFFVRKTYLTTIKKIDSQKLIIVIRSFRELKIIKSRLRELTS